MIKKRSDGVVTYLNISLTPPHVVECTATACWQLHSDPTFTTAAPLSPTTSIIAGHAIMIGPGYREMALMVPHVLS